VGSPTDEILMQQVRAGEVHQLAILFERYHAGLFRYYLRMTGNRAWSEDMVQEVFYRVLKSRETFWKDAPFATWLYRIARNLYLDQIKRRKREVALEDWDAPAREGASAERREEEALLRRALMELPPEKREVLVLSRYQEMKYDEIAELIGCEVATVKTRVHRALKSLRETYLELAGKRSV
jgi:RNA polymerase sigma-70 factor, ECF subfamily